MLVLNISRILRLRGIEHHQHFLKKLGFAASSVYMFLNGNSGQIRYEQIEKLCLALNCTPNDLFEWHPNAEQKVAETHSINRLKKTDLTQTLSEIPIDKFEQIAELLQESKSK